MNYEFKLPDIGEGLVEGEIVKWFVKSGDTVAEHQPIAAVLTDKAEVEIPSPKAGTIAKLHGKPGDKIKVGSPLVSINVAGGPAAEATSEKAAEVEIASPKAGRVAKLHAKPGQKVMVHGPLVTYSGVSGAETTAAPTAARPSRAANEVFATPMVRKMAKDQGIDIGQVQGTGPLGRVLASDLSKVTSGGKANATSAVKSLACALGVDLSRVAGTGPGGRISEMDVRAAAPSAKTASPAHTSASMSSGYPPVSIPRAPGDTTVPFAGIRRKIAEKMQQSRRTVAHVTHMDECDMTAVLALREKLKPEAVKKGVKLTFLPFIIRALVKSLSEFPMFNSSLDEVTGEIVVKRRHNIGVAVAAPQGLVVPNIKSAQNKDVWALAAEISTLAEKVRAKTIDVPSLQDGTFTITNIGPIGGLFATPIVNHPEVAILGLMKMHKRPVVRDNMIAIRDMMSLALSFDHRVVDGADAASFMNTIIKHLENPQTLL